MRALLNTIGLTVWGATGALVLGAIILATYHVLMLRTAPAPQGGQASTSAWFHGRTDADPMTRPAGGSSADKATRPNPLAAPVPSGHYLTLAKQARELLPSLETDRNRLMAYRLIFHSRYIGSAGEAAEMARLLFQAGEFGAARQVLEAALAGDPVPAEPAQSRDQAVSQLRTAALLESADGRYRESTGHISMPGQPEEDLVYGEICFVAGRYREAAATLEKYLEQRDITGYPEAYVYLGLSYEALHQYPDARIAFHQLRYVREIDRRVADLWERYIPWYLR